MDFSEVSLIKNELYGLSYSFVFDDISTRFWIDNADFPEVCRAIESDQNFICTIDDENEGKRYVAKRTLYEWFIKLNLRLAIIKFCGLSESQLLSQINGLRLSSTWNYLPSSYIEFGQNSGFLSRLEGQDRYTFPISYTMSFFSRSNIKAAREYLLNRSYDEDITPQFEQLILERLQNALEPLKSQQQYVILRRQGILGFNHMTLEQIGQQMEVTRERIRQIEERCWKRIWHHLFQARLVPLLLIYVLNRKGSLLVSPSNIHREIEFICKCLNVPLWTFPYINITSIGEVNNSINLPENVWIDLSKLEANVNNFLSSLPLQLVQEDVEEITDMLVPIIFKRLTKTQKVYLVLKQIGKPAHFSEIADMYMHMFPKEHPTEHSVHALLLNEKYGVVWVGSKGKFALEEWGYERPASTLMDTIASIVEEKYQNTGIPVPFIVIQAEIGKYRKVLNPNSLVLASYLNPRLKNVDDFCFLPQEEASEEPEVADDNLDRILREFERKADE